MPFLQIGREKVSAAWMPGAAITGHDRSISDIDMRRNALRLLAPYNNLRYALRGLHWHGYIGMEKEAVDLISEWVKNPSE